MKNLYTLGLIFIFSSAAFAQSAPGVEWEQCIPNSSITSAVTVSSHQFTVLFDILKCDDSSAVGLSSYDGDGNLLWEKTYFPPPASSYHSFCLTKNDTSGYLITGSLIKPDSTFNWYMFTDTSGNILVSKTIYFDSVAAPHYSKIIRDNVNGFLFAGETYTSHLRDLLILHLAQTGDVATQQILGGSLFDYMGDVAATIDGGYIFAAYTTSNDFDVTGNHGQKDIWIVKTDEGGDLQWSRCYGDTMNEEAHSILTLNDGYFVAGMSQSNRGIVRSHSGTTDFYDYWILKIDYDGSLMWNKSFGGQRGDFVSQMSMAGDSTIVITGSSYSVNGNISDHHNNEIYDDQWTMKMKLDSTVVWTKSTGGSFDDWAHCITLLDSTQMIVAGGTLSSDDDHHSSCFSNDCRVISGGWMVKLNEQCSNFPTVKFSYTQESQNAKEFQFSNESYNATSYLWTFGDGNTSTEENPIHFFTYNGIYTVCLKASYDTCSAKTVCTTISTCVDPVVAGFHVNYPAGLSVAFIDQSQNAAQWFWDFGDGEVSSEENPTHEYSANGNFTVLLVVTDSCDNKDSIAKVVNTCNGFTANFNYDAQFNEVSFTDLTQGLPDSWTWFFGDGGESTDENPTHIYSAAGNYPVCVISSNSTCPNDTFCEVITVQCSPFSALFNYTSDFNLVQFSDASENATTWNWDFGDGNISIDQNPSHTYTSSGTYTVCLIAKDGCSADTLCQSVQVTCPLFVAGFSFDAVADTVNFTDESINAIEWTWDFNDGLTSAEQSPQHIYADTGTYIVCLTAYDGCSYDSSCDTVNIYALSVPDEVTTDFTFTIYPNPASEITTIEFKIPASEEIKILLEDVHGRTIEEIFNQRASKGKHQLQIQTNNLSKGIYPVKMITSSGIKTMKLVVN